MQIKNVADTAPAARYYHRFRRILELGRSRPWPEVLELMTGSAEMNASALLDYFRPLYDWLLTQNEGHSVGWQDECPPGSMAPLGPRPSTTTPRTSTSAAGPYSGLLFRIAATAVGLLQNYWRRYGHY